MPRLWRQDDDNQQGQPLEGRASDNVEGQDDDTQGYRVRWADSTEPDQSEPGGEPSVEGQDDDTEGYRRHYFGRTEEPSQNDEPRLDSVEAQDDDTEGFAVKKNRTEDSDGPNEGFSR